MRMNLIDSGDYHKLCAAIRERYDLTPDTYRRKFRPSRNFLMKPLKNGAFVPVDCLKGG